MCVGRYGSTEPGHLEVHFRSGGWTSPWVDNIPAMSPAIFTIHLFVLLVNTHQNTVLLQQGHRKF
jgi:hypothetical protein